MLSSGNFDAYYVQHPNNALGGSGSGGGPAGSNGNGGHAPNGGASSVDDPLSSNMVAGPSRYNNGGGVRQPLGMRANNIGGFPSAGVDTRNADAMNLGQPFGSYDNSAAYAQPQIAPQEFTAQHTNMGLPWNGMNIANSKDALFAQTGDRSTSPLWDNTYGLPFAVQSDQDLGIDASGIPQHLYSQYEGGPNTGMLDNAAFEEAPGLPGSLGAPDGAGNFLLSQYDLDLIGDDSGSGGMTRPTPKNKRRRTQKNAAGVAVQPQAQAQPTAQEVVDDGIPLPPTSTGSIDFDEINGSASDLIDELGGGLERLDEVASSGYNDASDVGALHEGLEGTEDEPLYVNPKQYNRILKRREVRARMEDKRKRTEEAIRTGKLSIDKLPGGRELAARLGLVGSAPSDDDKSSSVRRGSTGAGSVVDDGAGGKRTYQHESRHKHAMRRPRGPGGRFLTADEIKAKEAAEAAEAAAQQQASENQEQGVLSKDYDDRQLHQQGQAGSAGEPATSSHANNAQVGNGPEQTLTETRNDDDDETYNLLNLE